MADYTHDANGVTHVPVTSRTTEQLSPDDWWLLPASDNDNNNIGANRLMRRCVRTHGWSHDFAERVCKAYRQFLELKKVLEDWDAQIVAPSLAVEQMWKMHMMDPVSYIHDCLLLCGRVVGHDPDGELDEWAQEKRVMATKQLLKARYESHIDQDVWKFDSVKVEDGRQDVDVEERSRSMSVMQEERTLPIVDSRTSSSSIVEERTRFDEGSLDGASGKYSNYDISFRSGLSGKSSARQLLPTRKTLGLHPSDLDDAEMIRSDLKSKNTSFQIRIRTLKGQVYHFSVNRETTIDRIKRMVEEEHGTPKDQQHLLFYGKVLEDWATLGAHSIPPNAVLQLLARSKRSVDAAMESQAEGVTA
ncbi:hypothetical protein MPSEU_000973200 [Mayamaea pseudoterrestris]|nr:hypothetical protein MPSEU_000973200 [Mayamaea pseudoterrestris]